MDLEFNRKSVRVFVFVFGLWFLSFFMSCQEIRYAWSGKDTTGVVSKIDVERSRYGNQTGYRVWYNFQNENTNRRVDGYSVVDTDKGEDYDVGQEVQVQYFGDKIFTSRLTGERNTFWLFVFFGSLAAVIGFGAYMTIKEREPRKRPKPRKR